MNVTIPLLAVAASVAAYQVSLIVEASLGSVPTAFVTPTSRATTAPPPPLALSALARTLSLDSNAATNMVERTRPTARSSLVLLGTLEPSLAAVLDPVDHSVHTLGIGDTLRDERLISVGHSSVVLERDGERLSLECTLSRPSAARSIEKAATSTPTAAISHRDVDRLLAMNLPEVMSQIRLAPAMIDGRFALRVQHLAADSFISRAGLHVGDVITRVNGQPLTPTPSLQLLAGLSSAPQLDVELDRAGTSLRLSVAFNP